jgi:ATP-dependent Lhr-like helicase
VSVAPAPGGGRTRWLGSGRGVPAALARAQERILTGASPSCRLSRRAEAKLEELRQEFAFLDGTSLILLRSAGTVTAWTFSGSRANAAIARELRRAGLKVSSWDDLSVTVRAEMAEPVLAALAAADPMAARPDIPDDLDDALKFSACLPEAWVEQILLARLSDRHSVIGLLGRPRRVVNLAIDDP